MTPPPGMITVYDYSQQPILKNFTPCEKQALEYLLSDNFLNDHRGFVRGSGADLLMSAGSGFLSRALLMPLKKLWRFFDDHP